MQMPKIDFEKLIEDVSKDKSDRIQQTYYISKDVDAAFKKTCTAYKIKHNRTLEYLMIQFIEASKQKK